MCCVWDCFCSIPWLSIIGVAATIVGELLALEQRHVLLWAIDTLHLEVLNSFFLKFLWLIFILTMFINLVALVLHFLAAKVFRECCCDTSHESCCLGMLQCLLGPAAQFILFVLLTVTFLAQIPILEGVASIWGVTTILSGACLEGADLLKSASRYLIASGLVNYKSLGSNHTIVGQLGNLEHSATEAVEQGISDILHFKGNLTHIAPLAEKGVTAAEEAVQILYVALTDYCEIPNDLSWVTTCIGAGTIVCIIAQTMLLVLTYANFYRVWQAMIEAPEDSPESMKLKQRPGEA